VDSTRYAEVVGVAPGNAIEASFLARTGLQDGRIWQFHPADEWELVDPVRVTEHVSVPGGANGDTVVKAWRQLGFVAGGDGVTFCRTEDEELCELPLLLCEEDPEVEGAPSTKVSMCGYEEDGFAVPFEPGEEFTLASPGASSFVQETHRAVHEFENWQPSDTEGTNIKFFMDKLEQQAIVQTDNERFAQGQASLSTTRPPLH
jgi:hypothetical protein